ncbi:thioredoxin domain-containing protein [Nakamurella sp. A5-74]|uniref:Thioredoxin domain-containing protein n=1 Tax=Nakamurella sp. A5-74 TaxID=3158264 RepID=A0AAU8DRU8_9ACTN
MTTTGWMQVRGGLGGNRRWRQARRGRRAATSVALVAVLVAGCGGEVAGVAARGARTAASVERPSLPSDTGSAGTPATTSLPTTSSRPAPTGPGTTPPETTPPETRTTPPETTRSGAEPTSRATTSAAVTATLGDSGAIEVGSPSAKIVLDVYEEPMCPPCATFAARYGPDIAAAALSGKARVRFRIANFLDKQSHSKNYSTRAIAALLTVLAYDRDARTLLAVQDAIFDDRNQPIEGSDADLSDAQLATLAQQHGAGTESVAAIRTGLVRKTAAATARLTRSYMTAQKVSGVPWVQVDGRAVDLDDPQWLSKALTG